MSAFSTWFSFSSDQHNYETSWSTQGNLTKRFSKTQIDTGSIQSVQVLLGHGKKSKNN